MWTFLRIVFALIHIGGTLALSIFMFQTAGIFSQHINSSDIPCYEYQAMNNPYLLVLCAVPLYEFAIHPILYNYIPTMLTRIGIGIILHILSGVALFTIDFVGHEKETGGTNYTCLYDKTIPANSLHINLLWTMLPQGLIGLRFFLNFTGLHEFVFSQSPYNMKGLLMGAVYAINGLFLFLELPLQAPFYWGKGGNLTTLLSCGSVYLLVWLALSIAWFVIYVLVARGYHKRERGNTKWQQDYPEEYYSKYLRSRHQ